MKRKASVAAVMLAFAGTAAWAGVTEPNERADAAAATSNPTSNAPAEAVTGWKFENGAPAESSQAAGPESGESRGDAKTSLGVTEGDQAGSESQAAQSGDSANDSAAMSEEQGDQYQAANPDNAAGTSPNSSAAQSQEPAASTADESPAHSAQSPREAESGQAAQSQDQSDEQQAAGEQEQDSEQSAQSDDESSTDQSAMSEDEGQDEQAAGTEQDESDQQSAQSDEQSGDEEQSAESGQSQDEQSADSGMPAHLQGKVIVIIPKDWQGSMEGLLSALQSSPDAQDIVIVQQGGPTGSEEPRASGTQEPDDTYEASRTAPPMNQQ